MPSKAIKAIASSAAERVARKRQAEIDAIIAEFGGAADAPAALGSMAAALLGYRRWLRQLVDAGKMIEQGKPFAIIGPGPHWQPDQLKQWPWR